MSKISPINNPNGLDIEGLFAQAVSLQNKNRLEEAVGVYKEILLLNPSIPEVYYNLGCINHQLKDYNTARLLYSHALTIDPQYAEAANNLGNVYMGLMDFESAIKCFSRALKTKPDFFEALCSLAMCFVNIKDYKSALRCFDKILQIKPSESACYNNYANVLKALKQYDDAVANYLKAIELDEKSFFAYSGLGSLYFEAGMLDDAIALYQKGLKCTQVDNIKFNYLVSNYLYALNFRDDLTNEQISAEHFKYSHFFEPLKNNNTAQQIPWPNYNNTKIRIGFVSPDFKRHPVAFFLSPLFKNFDSERFDFYCYNNEIKEDDFTHHLKLYKINWRNIAVSDNDEVYKLIKDDRIDILFELTGHTSDNRLTLFGQKPAPKQVSWLGYPNTTGLNAIDFKFVDHYTDPVGLTEHLYSERLIRFNDCFLCYIPWSVLPPIAQLPALKNGYITFGCFNKITKVSNSAIEVWCRILKLLPDSRLLLKSKYFDFGQARQLTINKFLKHGITEDRLILSSWTNKHFEHLTIYNVVDICLDPFPYNGTTNTCEALSMGVPLISLVGNSHVSRVGYSLLSNAGLPEFIAHNVDEYVKKAVNLATDISSLIHWRQQLRQQLFNSPLSDINRFTTQFQSACKYVMEAS